MPSKNNKRSGSKTNKKPKPSKYTTKFFIKKARSKHGTKYNYSESEYINSKSKIKIICDEHGVFHQTPSSHLLGKGCIKCGYTKMAKKRSRTTKEFIKKAKLVHKNKYNYKHAIYINNGTKTKIICPTHGIFEQSPYNHLKGHECKKCADIQSSIKKKLSSKEVFAKKANLIHKNKYNYKKVIYLHNNKKVIIICPIHGEFTKAPSYHLRGSGCNQCNKNNKKSGIKNTLRKSKKHISPTDKFIHKSIIIHGDKYDYKDTEYVNTNTKVKIHCKIHGEFLQTPCCHLAKRGCQKCGKIITIKKTSSNVKEFIKKAQKIHKTTYSYNKVKYVNIDTNIIIICKKHGDFICSPHNHIRGTGCSKCSKELTNKSRSEEYFKKVAIVHKNVYSYKHSIYSAYYNTSKIKIKCYIHGYFNQLMCNHLAGSGCPGCTPSNYSKISIEWLESIAKKETIKIEHVKNKSEHLIKDSRYKADGYCKKTNTIYEFNGCFFHGCNECYHSDDINPVCKKSYGELYKKTMEKEKYILSKGYKLVTIWEHEYINQKKQNSESTLNIALDLINDIILLYTTKKSLCEYLKYSKIDITGIKWSNIHKYNNEIYKLFLIVYQNKNIIEKLVYEYD